MSEESVRLASYNVRYFGHALKGLASTRGLKRRIAGALSGLAPKADIICLQEVESKSVRSSLAGGTRAGEKQLDVFFRQFQEALASQNAADQYSAWYFPAHRYALGNVTAYSTGLAVLVNERALRVVSGNSDAPHNITDYRGGLPRVLKQTRISAHLTLENHAGRRLHVFNTHLSLPTPFASEFWTKEERMGYGANQLREARQLADFVASRAGTDPLVLCGDFNAAPGSPVHEFFRRDLGLAWAHGELRAGMSTSSAGFMGMRMHIDHVFGRQLRWVDANDTASVDDESAFRGLSDHMPQLVRFAY